MESIWARLGWIGVLVSTVAVPVLFTTRTQDVFTLTKATLALLAAIGLGMLWVLDAGWRRPLPGHAPVVGLYAGAIAVATGWSRSPQLSTVGMYGRFGGLVTTLSVVAISLIAAQLMLGRPDRQRQLLMAIAASGSLGGAYLIIQELGWDWFDWAASQYPAGVMGNSNFSGAHAALGLLALLAVLAPLDGRVRLVSAAAVLPAGIGLVVSGSRGAYLALLVGVVIGARRETDPAARRAAKLIVVAMVLVLLGAGSSFSRVTLDQRMDVWEVGLRGLPDHLLVGGGPDLFLVTFAEHRVEVPAVANVVADEPHNLLLDVADGSGLIGLAALLGVIVTVASYRSPGALGFVVVGAGYLAQAMFSIDVVGLQLLGWLAAAGVVAAGSPAPDRTAVPAASAVPAAAAAAAARRPIVRWLAVPAAIVLALAALVPFRADLAFRAGSLASRQREPVAVSLDHFAVAVERNPWQPIYHLRYAQELRRAARDTPPDQARALREEARHQRFLAERLIPKEALGLLDP